MRKIDSIIVHHSASEFGNTHLIDAWHKERGFSRVGYEFIILNGYIMAVDYYENKRWETLVGQIETGRPYTV